MGFSDRRNKLNRKPESLRDAAETASRKLSSGAEEGMSWADSPKPEGGVSSESSKEAVDTRYEAKKKAMRLLEYQDRTEKQLRDKLKEQDFSEEDIVEAITYVKSYHYLDDARYAAHFVSSRREEKSRYEIREELKKRGVSEDLISAALTANPPEEQATVKTQFLKKYGQKDLSDPKIYEKAFRYFGTRGFSYEEIKKAIAEALLESVEEER